MLDNPIWTGILLAFSNFIISLAIVLIGIKLKLKSLSSIVLIGFVVRYFLVASLIFYIFLNLDKANSRDFGLTFMISSFIFIMLEIIIFHYASNFVILQTENNDKDLE